MRRTSASLHSVAPLITAIAALVLTGCSIGTPIGPAARRPVAAPRPASLVLNWPVDESGRPGRPADCGVVIVEPIAKGTSTQQAAFGTGCARWLHLAVAGQGELAQTPVWASIDRARREMGLSELRLSLDETPSIAQKTGATHCVVGEISGTPENGSLTVAIANIGARKIVGKPVTIHGTRSEIVRQLPSLARTIGTRLGVANPVVPERADSAPDDFEFLGGLPWLPSRDLPEPAKKRLAALAPKTPLAALLALSCSDLRETAQCDALAHSLVSGEPGNVAVFGGLAYIYWHGCVSESAALDALCARYPGSFQLAAANMMRVRGTNAPQEAATAAALIRIAPRNPEAWLSAGYTESTAADAIRKGRFSNQLTSSESAALGPIYARWFSDVKKATELDPQFAHGWARLATAATFQGDSGLADRALQTALSLDPAEKDALEWGMQMYQPKWGGNPDKLIDIAHRAAEAYHWDSRVYDVAGALEAGEQPGEARHMRSEALKRQRAAAAAHPDDYTALSEYAWGLKRTERYGEAEAALRSLIKRFPHDSALNDNFHEALGMCLIEQKKRVEGISELVKASQSHPNNVEILRNLAYAYRQNAEPLKAIEVFERADRIDGGNANAYGMLADSLFDAHKYEDAVSAYRTALSQDSGQPMCWRNMSKALGQLGRFKEGIEAAQKALELNNTDFEAHQSLAYLYGMSKQYPKSLEECKTALQMRPDDPVTHANMGESLNNMNQRAEARREWETVLRLDPNGEAGKDARKMLAKYP